MTSDLQDDVLAADGVPTTWGRDYGDVPPLKGVIYTGGGRHLEVTVAVERLPE
jgi:hypothetical protein